MTFSDITALRLLASAVAVLLAVAVVIIHGSFWGDFLVGMALGLSIGVLTLVWSKRSAEVEKRDDGKPLELNLTR